MLLVFIDETFDSKFKDYFGLSIALINARFYPLLKSKSQQILKNVGWDPKVEFKGNYLFSASTGCTDIEVERRIVAANDLLTLNIAKSNCRMDFHYGRMKTNDQKAAYLGNLPALLYKALPKAPKGAGKNLIVINCDSRTDVSQIELENALLGVPSDKGYVLLEHPAFVKSSFNTIGVMFADIVGYLAGRIDTISNDAELFNGLTPEQFERNGKIRKLRSSSDLISKIRSLSIYTHKSFE